jgi:hypothetical protein
MNQSLVDPEKSQRCSRAFQRLRQWPTRKSPPWLREVAPLGIHVDLPQNPLPFRPIAATVLPIGRIVLPPKTSGTGPSSELEPAPHHAEEETLMRSSRDTSRPPVSPLDNAFSPAYLARLRERDDSLTAAEAVR